MTEQPPATSGPGARRGRGELESAVWEVLLAAGTPLSTGEVRERLGESLAYTTVVTTLGRLYAKGRLTRTLSGRAHRYTPATTVSGLAARRMHQALQAETDHEAVLTNFVSELSGRDEALLRRLLDDDLAGERDTGPDPGSGSRSVPDAQDG